MVLVSLPVPRMGWSLLAVQAETDKLRDETLRMQAQLKGFRDLPPDVSLAKVQVEKVRGQLQGLDAELRAVLDRISLA